MLPSRSVMNDFFRREIVTTKDGSSSIYLPAFDEHYHSVHGAVQESRHVFLRMGWEPLAEKPEAISILEIGFGTGLNAWLMLQEADRFPAKQIRYRSIEAYPVKEDDAALLNYAEDRERFLSLHKASWEKPFAVSPNFTLVKNEIRLEHFNPGEEFDLVFFDAFAPRVQPELWSAEVFRKMFSLMKKGGRLVTYCSKGEVRRNMIAAGFTVEKLPGPPGKREMLRAEKIL